MSDLHGANISLSTLRSILETFAWEKPLFIWGAPGIGKSSLVSQVAGENEWKVLDWRLSLKEPTDIMGIPFPDNGKCGWLPPKELPEEEGWIILLDELPHARRAVQAACYSLVHDRFVGSYKVPDKVWIIAAGNRGGLDGAATTKLDTPFANRFVHFNVQASLKDWETWALNNGVHHTVISFLQMKPEMFLKISHTSVAFPTPRSWAEGVSPVIDTKLPTSVRDAYVLGSVGKEAGTQYLEYLRIYERLPDIDQVLNGKLKSIEQESLDVRYLITGALAAAIIRDSKEEGYYRPGGGITPKYLKRMKNFIRFLGKDSMDVDLATSAVLLAMRNSIDFGPTKEVWQKWLEDHTDAISGGL